MSGADDQRGTEPDQCRYCPNDADRDEAGFLHCIECGWTDNPGEVVGLHETIDRLRAELADREDLMEVAQREMDRLRALNKSLRAELDATRALVPPLYWLGDEMPEGVIYDAPTTTDWKADE